MGGRKRKNASDGFEAWGGYMNAKIQKLEEQFTEEAAKVEKSKKESEIFDGVAIFVNGYTDPSSDELRLLMMVHGGTFHAYYRSTKTTHVIATNLPNAKINQLNTMKVVQPTWITESIAAGKLLDYKNYLLFKENSAIKDGFRLAEEKQAAKIAAKDGKEDLKPMKGVAKTAVDAEFLSEFYNNSRLHHLSTMGAMFKQYVGKLKESHKGDFIGRSRLTQVENTALVPETDKVIMHIDMDCFFVSVALRNHPELVGLPVAVTHAKSNSARARSGVDRNFEYQFYRRKMESKVGEESESSSSEEEVKDKKWTERVDSLAEVASCSYEARQCGVRNGMYLGTAMKLCPNLKTVPYDFEGYKEVSMSLYNTVAEYTLDVEAVSCDELFVDCTNLLRDTNISPLEFVSQLRSEIRIRTGCPSSAGLGSNKLQARLATKKAKPDGQFFLQPGHVEEFMSSIDVDDLPSVGRALSHKLRHLKVATCSDLQNISLDVLKKELGNKTGETLHKFSRGIDDRPVTSSHQRKSVSAEVNYGIRFTNTIEALAFFKQLSGEVSNRLQEVKLRGRLVTLKLMVRTKDAPVETAKYLGHGACDYINKSTSLPLTDDAATISKHVIQLYEALSIPPAELRGIGIQVTKLEAQSKAGGLDAFLKSKPKSKPKVEKLDKLQLPNASQLDRDVVDSLPEDIRLEIINEYGVSKIPKSPPKQPRQRTSPWAGLSFTLVRTMIKEWVKAEDCPQQCDVSMLTEHAQSLVYERRSDHVEILVRCLQRHVREVRGQALPWLRCYEYVLDGVQTAMVQVYNGRLEIR